MFGLAITLPSIVRLLGSDVPAEEPYRWSGEQSVFVRVDRGSLCEVTREDSDPENVYVPADNGGWLGIAGSDIKGGGHGTTSLSCEQEVSVTSGPTRLVTISLRWSGMSAFACVGTFIALIWFGFRTLYKGLRYGGGGLSA